jgi:tetratricopeptide (TPR) repeat protein
LTRADPRTGGTFANGREAIRLDNLAVQKDPNFAAAYLDMARAYLTLSYSNPGAASDSETVPPMKAAIAKAIEANPKFAEAHQLSAAVAYNLDYDWDTAGKEYRQTLELAPDSSAAHVSYSNYLSAIGEFNEAVEQAKRAEALDASAVTEAALGRIFYARRQYPEAEKYFLMSLAKQDNLAVRFYLGLAYLADGKSAEALKELKATTAEKNGGAYAGLAYAYAHLGDRNNARGLLDDLFAEQDPGMIVAYRIAAVYMELGDRPRALRWLNRSYDRHENWMAQLKVDPVMDPLRAEPGFEQLLAKMHFPKS